jgi:chitin disaccharide deacetylase
MPGASTNNGRTLIVIADDFGIGPEVSRSIAQLMRLGTVTGTVLLVNSPYAEADVKRWAASGRVGEVGWHPNLNLDRPVAPAGQVPSLLTAGGALAPLSAMLPRLAMGRIKYREVVRELDAQLRRFHDLVGGPPPVINGHKHIHAFPLVSRALTEVLQNWRLRPYVRRVAEPNSCLRNITGARVKRLFLSTLGRAAAKRQDRAGFAGNEWLAGITDPRWVDDPDFFARWIASVPGNIVELAVHPGHRDETLIGRDCTATDGQIERRVAEHRLLSHPGFTESCSKAGFTLRPASAVTPAYAGGRSHAAA